MSKWEEFKLLSNRFKIVLFFVSIISFYLTHELIKVIF